MVPEVGVEPTRAQGPLDFESSASTSFTTPAWGSASFNTATAFLLSRIKQYQLANLYIFRKL